MEVQIKDSLIALLGAIRSSDGRVLAKEIGVIEEYVARGRGTLHPQLVHFLERRSYAKALMFLGGETEIPVGACGGREKPRP